MKLVFTILIVFVAAPNVRGDWAYFWGQIKNVVLHPVTTIAHEFGYDPHSKVGKTIFEIADFITPTPFWLEVKEADYVTHLVGGKHIEKALNILGEETLKVSEEINKCINKLEVYMQDGWHEVKGFAQDLSSKFNDIYIRVKTESKAFFHQLEILEKSLDFSDLKTKQGFDLIKGFINDIEKFLQTTLNLMEKKVDSVSKQAVMLLFNKTTDLNVWAKSELATVKGKSKRVAESNIQKFVTNEVQTMRTCADKATEPIREIFEKAKKIVIDAGKTAWDAVNTVQHCTEKNDNIVTFLFNCVEDIVETGRDAYNLVQKDLGKMRNQIAKLAFDALKDSKCILDVELQTSIEKQKLDWFLHKK